MPGLQNFRGKSCFYSFDFIKISTAELQWLKHLWNHENIFETGVVRASEC